MPRRERLPFGPRGVGFFGGGVFGRVLVEDRTYGYRFVSRRFDGVPTRLGWYVTARMLSVDADGRPTGVLGRKRIRVRVIGGERQPGIFLKAGEGPGLYRFDIRFRDRRGRWLGAFTDYLRVMEPRTEVRLGIESRSLRTGDWLQTRVENAGTTTIYYGDGHERVEKLEGATWRPVPGALRNSFALAYLGILGPGGVGRCSGLAIRPFMTPGRYRVVKEVGLDFEWPTGGESTEVSAWFDVVG